MLSENGGATAEQRGSHEYVELDRAAEGAHG
jgi:hypothetical protein